jgi:DNA-binding transcriptional LysR family regulator
MDFDSLRIVVDVARRGSFAAAARERGVDPSAVSRAVAAVERDLGFRLFQRSTRQLAPTDPGALYLRRAAAALEEMDGARDDALAAHARVAGVLRATVSIAFGLKRVVPLLPELRARHPDLSVDLVISDANLDLIAEGIDLAVRLGARPPQAGLIAMKLAATRYRACASPEFLAANTPIGEPADLSERECVLFPYSGYRSKWRFRARSGDIVETPVSGALMLSSALAVHDAALRGLGVALLPCWLIAADVKAGRLVDIFPEHDVTATEFDTAAWIVYPSRAYIPRKLRAFIDFLVPYFREG